MNTQNTTGLNRTLGTWHVAAAGIGLVVAASSLVSDFAGYFTLGGFFALAVLVGFVVNLLLGLSAADLSVAYPRAGALYDYARAIFKGRSGRILGVFLGLAFFGMGTLAISGEMAAGGFGMQALFNSDAPIGIYIVILSVLAVIPNVLGIQTAAWVTIGLTVAMIGIRWFFGIAGFLGFSNTGAWSLDNLFQGAGSFSLFGDTGILTAGLALAIWGFIGIEFAGSLAEEVKDPKKAMPRGMVYGLIIILLTSLIMGLGVTGTQPLSVWQEANAGVLGNGGNSPQLAVGTMMFGDLGFSLMALASALATLSSLTIVYASMPRLIYSIARDGGLGRFGSFLGRLHPKFRTPVNATLFTLVLYVSTSLLSDAVIEWVYSAVYTWLLLYAVFHVLAIANRKRNPDTKRAFSGRWFVPMAVLGIVATAFSTYVAFYGEHLVYGTRALIVLAVAALVAAVAAGFRMRRSISSIGTASSEIKLSSLKLDK